MGATGCKEKSMELWLAGISALGLTVYLMFALLRPERF
ncbi:MAG: K(+)-transporting ATPase subunit F [Janthinobacterium lividum]